MRICTFLCLVLFVTNSSAFTVVLKSTFSGKQISGQLLSEDSETLNLRDASGITLHFQKHTLDLDAMKSANAQPKPPAQTPLPSRKPAARIYTVEDLDRLPELSQFSDSEIESPVVSREPQLDESKWRKASASLRKAKAKAELRWQTADAKCRKARETLIVPLKRNSITFVDPSDQPPDCVKAEELRLQLDEAVRSWDEFTDDARKAGVPWSVIE